MYPPVLQMQVSLLGMHMVPFNDTYGLEEVASRALSQRYMLTEYFKMNIEDPKAHQYLYREFLDIIYWLSLVNIGNQRNNISKLEGWFMLI
jgi:hypothetical protein